jgi:hypothetical protein
MGVYTHTQVSETSGTKWFQVFRLKIYISLLRPTCFLQSRHLILLDFVTSMIIFNDEYKLRISVLLKFLCVPITPIKILFNPPMPSGNYSVFTDEVERNCHFPAPGWNCMNHPPSAKRFSRVKYRSIKIIKSTYPYYSSSCREPGSDSCVQLH